MRPVVDYYLKQGQVTVCSNYPDIFKGSGASVEPFSRDNIDVIAHYSQARDNPNTTQFQDVCNCAKAGELQLRFDWQVDNQNLIGNLKLKANGKKIILV